MRTCHGDVVKGFLGVGICVATKLRFWGLYHRRRCRIHVSAGRLWRGTRCRRQAREAPLPGASRHDGVLRWQDVAEAEAVYPPLIALALAPDTGPRLAAVRPALLQVRAPARRPQG